MGESQDPTSPSSGDGGTPSNCPTQSCCKPIQSIKIVSIEFLSDHNLLKDNASDWKDGGARYPDVEWTPAHQHPLSHTMDRPAEIKVKIEVLPPDACSETGTLRGEGPQGVVFEKAGVSFSKGKQEITLNSGTKKIADKTQSAYKGVRKCDFQINWSSSGTSVPITPSSTTNAMFVTFDQPFGSEVTYKRLAWAVDVCKGKVDVDEIVLAAHKKINTTEPPKFNVATDEWPADTPPIWRMMEVGHSGGSCIAHSNLLKHIANILGVPGGTLEKVYSSTDSNFSSEETHTIHGRSCRPVVVVDKDGGAYEWNWYEACLHINGKWYPGAFGEKSFSSTKAVHKDYAKPPNRLVYITIDGGPRRFFDKNGVSYQHGNDIPYHKCIPVP